MAWTSCMNMGGGPNHMKGKFTTRWWIFTPDKNVVDFWLLWRYPAVLCSVELVHLQKMKAHMDSFHWKGKYTYRHTRIWYINIGRNEKITLVEMDSFSVFQKEDFWGLMCPDEVVNEYSRILSMEELSFCCVQMSFW